MLKLHYDDDVVVVAMMQLLSSSIEQCTLLSPVYKISLYHLHLNLSRLHSFAVLIIITAHFHSV